MALVVAAVSVFIKQKDSDLEDDDSSIKSADESDDDDPREEDRINCVLP
jgi:hypothetical protein